MLSGLAPSLRRRLRSDQAAERLENNYPRFFTGSALNPQNRWAPNDVDLESSSWSAGSGREISPVETMPGNLFGMPEF